MQTEITLNSGKKIRFSLGGVRAIHEIGDIAIVEGGRPNEAAGFHVYVDGKRTGQYWGTLDMAIVGALGYKYDGLNSQAALYFIKMVGMTLDGENDEL